MNHHQRPVAEAPKRCTGDAGAGLVEYAMLMALIAVVCIGAITFFGHQASSLANCDATHINDPVNNQNPCP
jgi:hypothetical protein